MSGESRTFWKGFQMFLWDETDEMTGNPGSTGTKYYFRTLSFVDSKIENEFVTQRYKEITSDLRLALFFGGCLYCSFFIVDWFLINDKSTMGIYISVFARISTLLISLGIGYLANQKKHHLRLPSIVSFGFLFSLLFIVFLVFIELNKSPGIIVHNTGIILIFLYGAAYLRIRFTHMLRVSLVIFPTMWLINSTYSVESATIFAYNLHLFAAVLLCCLASRSIERRVRTKFVIRRQLTHSENRLKETLNYRDKFFGNITHELKSPATALLAITNQAIRGDYGEINETLKKNLVHARSEVRGLSDMIDKILTVNSITDNQVRLTASENDINTFVASICKSYRSRAEFHGIQLRYNIPEQETLLYFDEKKMTSIISELIANALKYTSVKYKSKGGIVDIEVRNHDKTSSKNVIIEVSDNGPGIHENELKHVFTRLYRSRGKTSTFRKGAGLGLSIVDEYVKLHGGTIEAVSKLDMWTMFRITLPSGKDHLRDEEIISRKKSSLPKNVPYEDALSFPVSTTYRINKQATQPSTSHQKILIVDDEENVRSLIANCLDNYRILEAADGKEGFEVAVNEQPSLIITDLMMPHGGIELCEALQDSDETSHIPVIVLSALKAQDSIRMAYEMGSIDYISKPYEDDQLRLKVANLLRLQEESLRRLQELGAPNQKGNNPRSNDQYLIKVKSIVQEYIRSHWDEDPVWEWENAAVNALIKKRMGIQGDTAARKIRQETGVQYTDFLHLTRIELIPEILKREPGASITTIGAMLGYKDSSSFSKKCKMITQKTPSEYVTSLS